jgi:hypothetical protein
VKEKKIIYYQLRLKGKIKSNKIFIKKLKKIRNHKNKDQIENNNTW